MRGIASFLHLIYNNQVSQIKAVFFDYDGVMSYDKTGTESVCKYISKYAEVDKEIFEKEYRKFLGKLIYSKTPHTEIWNELCADIGINIPISFLYLSFNKTPVDSGMHDLVLKIREKGFKTGLITGNSIDRMDFIIHTYELKKYFDVFAISAELGFGKSSEEIFLHALKTLKLSPQECVFIDNQDKNLLVPRKMGIHVIYFDDETRDVERLMSNLKKHGINL